MSTKNSSTSTTLLIVLMIIITFPFWFAIGGMVIGLLAAVFGVVFGVFGTILGAAFALIALPFKLLFGWGDWSCGISGFHGNGFVWFALLIIAALIITRKNR
jgi:hypothetical protein